MISTDPSQTFQLLLQIREGLAQFRTVQCGLVHEKITGMQQTTIMEDTYTVQSYQFARVGFCAPHNRQWLLNCAHTMAAANYTHLLGQLEGTGIFVAKTLPVLDLKQTLTAIYLLDHRKGDAEKQLALLQLANNNTQALTETQLQLHQIQQEHIQLVTILTDLHQEILDRIDGLLSNMKTDKQLSANN
jgi:hypothetical protein